MIPKRIFYVWGYGEPKNQITNICLENWRTMLPNYEIIEINEKTPQWFDFEQEYKNNLWFKTVYDLKMWAYVADYMRIAVLLNHGGIYFDTDVTVYKDLETLLKDKMFIGNVRNNHPELAIIGAEKGHPYLKDLFEFYKEEIWKSPLYIIVQVFMKILEKYQVQYTTKEICGNELIKIYPPEYISPYHYGEEFTHDLITPNTYTVHWENGSWIRKKILFFLVNKHRIPLKTLLKQIDWIEKNDKTANDKTKSKIKE